MKQLFVSFLAAWLLPLAAQAQYTYTTNSGAITITGYSGPGGTVTIPDTINGHLVTSIGDDAFQYNNNLTNLIVGTNVLSLGRNTFAYNTNLATVIIPNSVTNIVGGTFYNCTNLVSVTLGNGVLSVGDSAFAFDASLEALYFQGNAPTFVSLTSVFYAVLKATIYYNAGTTGWATKYDALSTATIQSQYQYSSDGVAITITNYVGSGGAVAIPAAITSLPVTSIGYEAFDTYLDLTSVIIPNSVTIIGVGAFVYCSVLTNVTIPDSVTSIGGAAFFDCISLASITIPDSVISMGNMAFGACGLTSVTIPNSVTNNIAAAFIYCNDLSAITVAPQNIFYSSVGGVLFDKNQTTLVECPGGLAGTYVIPNSVTRIEIEAFDGCHNLTHITIPNSVTNIGADAFEDCTGLTGITIPNSLTSIGDYAFYICSGLKNLLFQGSAPALGGPNVFGGVNTAATVYYLAGSTGWGTSYGGAFDAPVDVANGILPTVELFVPTLRNISVAGGFSFAVTGVTNETVVVEASTNLLNWQPIQTNSIPPFQFNDPHWTSYPVRFYRVLYSP